MIRNFPRRQAALFLLLFLFALAASLPLRVAVDLLGLAYRGLAAREASGTIWSGRLAEAQFGPARIGDLDTRLRLLPLLLGRASLAVSDPAPQGISGTFSVSPWTTGFADVHATLPTGTLLAPLPITAFRLDGVSVRFDAQGCAQARGLVRAQTSGSLGALSLPSGFTGTARCDGGRLLLPLTTQSGMEAIDLRFGPAGRYDAVVRVRPADGAAAAQLLAAGFRQTSGSYVLRLRGQLRPVSRP